MSARVFIVLCLSVSGALASDACVDRQAGMEACLTGIRNAFTDRRRFWFGEHLDLCPDLSVDPLPLRCFNYRRSDGVTLEERIFRVQDFFNKDLIDRYLDITFTSEPGNYSGCEHEVSIPDGATFSLDPLSTVTLKPYSLRRTPVVTVSQAPPVGKAYTLVIDDVANRVIHGMYVNFDGNDISAATPVVPYFGPGNFRVDGNPYVFLLFEQADADLQVPDDVLARMRSQETLNVTDAMLSLGLTGPVAANWILSAYDAYTVQNGRSYGVGENCAGLVNTVLLNHQRPWAPQGTELSVFMKVELTVKEYSYDICGQTHSFEAGVVSLDPLGTEMLDPAHVQASLVTDLTFKLNMNKPYADSNKDFNGRYYTLLMVDPDVPVPCVATEAAPLVHVAVVDIPVTPGPPALRPPAWGDARPVRYAQLDLIAAKELLPYRGPNPPNDPAHVYYFLLFEQQSSDLGITSYEDENFKKHHSFPCSERLLGRCAFNIADFAMGNNLKLVGASWMHVRLTDWKAFTTESLNQTAYCADPRGWDWGVQARIDACPPPQTTPTPTDRDTSAAGPLALAFTLPLLGLVVTWVV